MKKYLLSLTLLLISFSALQAQSLRIGVKAGTNMNKISGQSFDNGYDFAYHAGAFLELDVNKAWGIQPEVIWSQFSGTPSNIKVVYATSIVSPTVDVTQPIKLNYLSIPVLLRVNLTGMFSIVAGPQYSILLSQDNTLLKNGQDAFKKGDFAMVAGAQVNLKYFRIYGRYNIGLQNLNDIDSQDKWKSQQIQLGLGFRL